MIRSAADVIQAARDRRFEIKVKPGPPPMPYLVGKTTEATPALIEALKAFRLEIIEIVLAQQPVVEEVPLLTPPTVSEVELLKPPEVEKVELPPESPRREWLWRFGQTCTGREEMAADQHPVGAWWRRWQGETIWRLTPMGEQHANGTEPPAT